MFTLKIVRPRANFVRHQTTLKGRVIPNPQKLSSQALKSILWTAIDLRERLVLKRTTLKDIHGAQILLLLTKPAPLLQVPAVHAAEMLDAKMNVVVDPNWDTGGYIKDTMKVLQSQTDLIIGQCRFQCFLDQITELNVPLFIFKSFRFKAMETLSDFMTIHLRYGRLKGIKIAWLGQPNRLLNSYLTIGTKFGINISYCCSCNINRRQSPALLLAAKEICDQTKSVLEECTSAPDAMQSAQVIVTSKKGDFDQTLTLEMLMDASPDCTTIFHLPRGPKQVDDAVVNSDRCLTWQTAENLQWVFAAVMLRLLTDYKHSIPMPNF